MHTFHNILPTTIFMAEHRKVRQKVWAVPLWYTGPSLYRTQINTALSLVSGVKQRATELIGTFLVPLGTNGCHIALHGTRGYRARPFGTLQLQMAPIEVPDWHPCGTFIFNSLNCRAPPYLSEHCIPVL